MAIVYGVTLADIPEGATPIEAIVILKALDQDGEVCLYRRASEGLAPWDQIGLCQIVLDNMRDLGQHAHQSLEASIRSTIGGEF